MYSRGQFGVCGKDAIIHKICKNVLFIMELLSSDFYLSLQYNITLTSVSIWICLYLYGHVEKCVTNCVLPRGTCKSDEGNCLPSEHLLLACDSVFIETCTSCCFLVAVCTTEILALHYISVWCIRKCLEGILVLDCSM